MKNKLDIQDPLDFAEEEDARRQEDVTIQPKPMRILSQKEQDELLGFDAEEGDDEGYSEGCEITLSLDENLFTKLALEAHRNDLTLNEYINSILRREVEQ